MVRIDLSDVKLPDELTSEIEAGFDPEEDDEESSGSGK